MTDKKEQEREYNPIVDLTERVEKLEGSLRKNNPVMRRIVAGAGAGAGAYASYSLLGGIARELGEGAGNALHAVDSVAKLVNHYVEKPEVVAKYIELLPAEVRENYAKSGNDSLIAEAMVRSLEYAQRSAKSVPGMNSAPVKTVTGLKGKIFEWTKGLGGKKAAEEAKIQNSGEGSSYVVNYDNLSELRDSAIDRRESLKDSIAKQTRKLEVNELNSGNVDGEGMKTLEGLAREYNNVSGFLGNIRELSPQEVKDAELRFKEVKTQADKYGIKPYRAEGFGDGAVFGVGVLGALVGYKVGKIVSNAVNRPYSFSKRIIHKLAKRKKLNTGEREK